MEFSASLFETCVQFPVIEWLARSEVVLVRLWLKTAWSCNGLLLRLIDLGLINRRYRLILVRNLQWRNDWCRWCRILIGRLDRVWRKLENLLRSELYSWWQMYSELARFNPVVLKFRKRVWLSCDELVDVAVVKRFPQVLFLQQKIFKF